MNTIAEFTIIPIGVGVSLSKYVAACEQILDESGYTAMWMQDPTERRS